MINRRYAKLYCCEDISLIENYDKAKKDLIEVWDIHHRKGDEGYSKQELIDLDMYYNRPASELKFLTHSEHRFLHSKGKKHSDETKKKMSLNHADFKGEKSSRSKPVLQIDKKTGDVIKTWPCTWEVQRVLGINPSHISQCCLGKRKSAGGYGWRHAS